MHPKGFAESANEVPNMSETSGSSLNVFEISMSSLTVETDELLIRDERSVRRKWRHVDILRDSDIHAHV